MRAALALVALIGCASNPSDPPQAIVDAGCDDACRAQTLVARVGDRSEPFERAIYGRTPPSQSSSKQWELHVEALHGGFTGCPVEMSPTPERTLVIAGLLLPLAAQSYASGVRVSLLDFKGTITKEPILRATTATITPVLDEACTDCPPPGDVVFELRAELADVVVEGRVRATHCPSLDTTP